MIGPTPPEQPAGVRPPAEDLQAAQVLSVEESCRRLTEYLEHIVAGDQQSPLHVELLSEPCRNLGSALCSFCALVEKLNAYSSRLAQGDLSQEPPENSGCLSGGLKSLYDNMKYLTQQAERVTKGDYPQSVPQLGEFSDAFNAMIRQMREWEVRLKEEVQRARRRADIIESYTEMLVELLDQRDEWMLVVDLETREIIHCNKRTRGTDEGEAYCDSCRHRLSIQPALLGWDGSERYKVWEIEENQGSCYRIISFPIEWKERPSCVHIVMDVTAEKMKARHLSDDIYQDLETGIRNRLFLEEFMGQVLRERKDITLCCLDLEGVADINTSYGRKVGDAYIQNFVEIVRKNFRSGDTFARIRDGKFCLILTGNVKHLIERKMNEILVAFQRDDDRVFSHRCNFKYSIVEVQGESNVMSLDKLLESAEEAIKRQKRKQERLKRRGLLDDMDW